MNSIKTIIFDLGGVLLDIDFKQSEKAFQQLGVPQFSQMAGMAGSNELFTSLETGLDVQQFYEQFRQLTNLTISNAQINAAWNALLLDFRKESMQHLLLLKQKYKLYLLSNTNEIHAKEFQKKLALQLPSLSWDACFNACYFSHKIGIRKPNAKAWLYILNKQKLKAEDTLFIDDSVINIEAAKQLGMQTIQLLPNMKIENLGL